MCQNFNVAVFIICIILAGCSQSFGQVSPVVSNTVDAAVFGISGAGVSGNYLLSLE
jgi:hypothetical protein